MFLLRVHLNIGGRRCVGTVCDNFCPFSAFVVSSAKIGKTIGKLVGLFKRVGGLPASVQEKT